MTPPAEVQPFEGYCSGFRPGAGLRRGLILALLLSPLASWAQAPRSAQPGPPAAPPYEFRTKHSPDGIGKFYLGREIAQVMGHQSAEWLERPERDRKSTPLR